MNAGRSSRRKTSIFDTEKKAPHAKNRLNVDLAGGTIMDYKMPNELTNDILTLVRSVDLYGRNEQFSRLVNEKKYVEAIQICDLALMDSEEMTRPDRTVFRRNVHMQNQVRVQMLRDKTEELLREDH
jgi:hypothetical protein